MTMTNEEKQLLLQDLSARLPYGVKGKVETCDGNGQEITDEGTINSTFIDEYGAAYICIESAEYELEDVKSYLRPIDTMTEDEKGELWFLLTEGRINIELNSNGQLITRDDVKLGFNYPFVCPQGSGEYIDFLNAHHFDYRGLIEKGLALPALEEMYDN